MTLHVRAPAAEAPAPAPRKPAPPQRASGAIRLGFRRRGERTALHTLFQEGSAKARLPRAFGPVPEAVMINTAGGLTGGDRFANDIRCAAGAHAVVTTQACERIYRSAGGEAEVTTRVELDEQAGLDWLPQETILFDGGRLFRRLEVEMAASAALLAAEAVIFGRAARGETVRSGLLRDRWRIRRAGRLVFADDLRFGGEVDALLSHRATLNGNGAMATVLLVSPAASERLDAAREAIGEAGGASSWDGKLVARIAASDGFLLRQTLIPLLGVLTEGRALPKVWQL